MGVASTLALLAFGAGLAPLVSGCGGDSKDAPPQNDVGVDAGKDTGNLPDPTDFVIPPTSCGYDCPQKDCPEIAGNYACPALGAWDGIPHADTCGTWDGKPPAAITGKCTVSASSGDAIKYAGKDPADAATTVLPEGRRVKPMGKEWMFRDAVLPGGLTTFLGAIGLTSKRWVVTVDTGQGPHVVRLLDVDKLLAGDDPLRGLVKFDAPETLNSSAVFVAPDLLYVATSDKVVQAIKVDTATGVLTRDDARSLKLPSSVSSTGKDIPWHVAAIAASPDGKRLVAAGVIEKSLLVFDVGAGSPTFGTLTGQTDLGNKEAFAAAFDPNDPTGRFVYVSHWGARTLDEVDITDPKAPKTTRHFATDQDPEGFTFLDARWLVSANAFGDTLTLVDRVAGTSTSIPADSATKLHGSDPSTLAYDPLQKRLYATLAGMNALATWTVDTTTTPPTLTPSGRVPTGWWPSGVVVLPAGIVVIANMRGGNVDSDPTYYAIADANVSDHMSGTVQALNRPTASELVAGEAAVKKNDDVAALEGAPKVTCPEGADDFPIPTTNTKGPSKQIQHIIFVVRENKSFDGVFGDFPGVEGKADLTILKTKEKMDELWKNFRQLGRDFSLSDNYYTAAELSEQGHFWTVYGRSADVNERTWPTDQYNRDIRGNVLPLGGVLPLGQPDYGGGFDWLLANKVPITILGEALGLPKPVAGQTPVDSQYPGGFSQANFGYPDVERACYLGGRIRVTCDLPAFTYACLMNDHTHGFGAGISPGSMIAVNDEGTGMLIDALSHSPTWASTLVVITEDDPSGGGEHIDVHRTPIVLVSPWVKKGYVSHTHMDVAGLHKMFAHILGVPYSNAISEHAAIPYDMFTSTPDFTPWNYQKRQWPLECGAKAATKPELLLTESWELQEVDENPALDRQVVRALRNEPLQSLPPAVEAAARARIERKKLGLEVDDD